MKRLRKSSGSRIGTATTTSGTRWPPEDSFLLRDLDTLKKVRTLKGEWLGIYQGIWDGFSQGTPSHELLFASRSPAILYHKIKRVALVSPFIVRRAPSRGGLPPVIEPSRPDNFAQLRRSSFEAVARARSLLNPNSIGLTCVRLHGYPWFVYELMDDGLIKVVEAKSLSQTLEKLYGVLVEIEEHAGRGTTSRPQDYPPLTTQFLDALRTARERGDFHVENHDAQVKIDEFLISSEKGVRAKCEEMREAADFLRALANEARSKGAKAGDRTTVEEIRKALRVFHRLAKGETPKGIAQVAINGLVDDAQSLKITNCWKGSPSVLEDVLERQFSISTARTFEPSVTITSFTPFEIGRGLTLTKIDLHSWKLPDRDCQESVYSENQDRGLPNSTQFCRNPVEPIP